MAAQLVAGAVAEALSAPCIACRHYAAWGGTAGKVLLKDRRYARAKLREWKWFMDCAQCFR